MIQKLLLVFDASYIEQFDFPLERRKDGNKSDEKATKQCQA